MVNRTKPPDTWVYVPPSLPKGASQSPHYIPIGFLSIQSPPISPRFSCFSPSVCPLSITPATLVVLLRRFSSTIPYPRYAPFPLFLDPLAPPLTSTPTQSKPTPIVIQRPLLLQPTERFLWGFKLVRHSKSSPSFLYLSIAIQVCKKTS